MRGIMCAEGALIVKRPFGGSKVGRSGPNDYKSSPKSDLKNDPLGFFPPCYGGVQIRGREKT